MTDGIKKLLTLAVAALLVAGAPLTEDRAAAQGGSVLRTATGLASNDINVLINRAIIIEKGAVVYDGGFGELDANPEISQQYLAV